MSSRKVRSRRTKSDFTVLQRSEIVEYVRRDYWFRPGVTRIQRTRNVDKSKQIVFDTTFDMISSNSEMSFSAWRMRAAKDFGGSALCKWTIS